MLQQAVLSPHVRHMHSVRRQSTPQYFSQYSHGCCHGCHGSRSCHAILSWHHLASRLMMKTGWSISPHALRPDARTLHKSIERCWLTTNISGQQSCILPHQCYQLAALLMTCHAASCHQVYCCRCSCLLMWHGGPPTSLEGAPCSCKPASKWQVL